MLRKMKSPIWWAAIYAFLGGVVFILGLNLLSLVPAAFRDIFKAGLPVVFLALYFLLRGYFPNQTTIFLAFFLVAAGWALDYYLTGIIKTRFSLNPGELSGFAYTMCISTLLVSIPVILGWLMAGRELSTIYLQGSGKIWGITAGITGLFFFGGLGALQALSQGLEIKAIGAALPMALVFSLANGFREELVYRAVFLRSFQKNIGVVPAIVVTTLVFALAHLDVSYTPANLIVFSIVLVIIGAAGSLIMMKTGSLIGAVLFHAGADILLLMGLLSSGQLVLP